MISIPTKVSRFLNERFLYTLFNTKAMIDIGISVYAEFMDHMICDIDQQSCRDVGKADGSLAECLGAIQKKSLSRHSASTYIKAWSICRRGRFLHPSSKRSLKNNITTSSNHPSK